MRWRWSSRNAHSLLAGVRAGTSALGQRLALPNRVTVYTPFKPAIPLRSMYPRKPSARYKSVDSTLSVLAKTGNDPNVHYQESGQTNWTIVLQQKSTQQRILTYWLQWQINVQDSHTLLGKRKFMVWLYQKEVQKEPNYMLLFSNLYIYSKVKKSKAIITPNFKTVGDHFCGGWGAGEGQKELDQEGTLGFSYIPLMFS